MTVAQIADHETSVLSSMPERQTDAGWLNTLANHPDIHPWVCGRDSGPLDLSPVVADQANVCLAGQYGGTVFTPVQPGIYEAHSLCLPEGRGPWMLDFVRDCLKWLFTRTDCVEMMTRCPKGNLAAKALARSVGFANEFTNPRGWVYGGKTVPADIYALRIQDWMRTAPGLEDRGHWFHEKLEREFDRLGKTEPQHPDDPVHDRYVGAAVDMFLGGQPLKGQLFYSRWAQFAGYAPIAVQRTNPLVVDIGNALIVIRNGDFYVAALTQEH